MIPWPGRRYPTAIARRYLRVAEVEEPLPADIAGIRLLPARSLTGLQVALQREGFDSDEVEALSEEYTYVLELRDFEVGDASIAIAAAVDGLRIWSDASIEVGPLIMIEDGHADLHRREQQMSGPWGHVDTRLEQSAVRRAAEFAPRICELSRLEAFNPLSNALRLYTESLELVPSDLALVAFVSALEGLFTTSSENISFRFRLGVAFFLETEKEARVKVREEAKRLYAARSKVVHGTKIASSEEKSAITLAEDLVPRAEQLARRCFQRIFEEQLDAFFETARNERRDDFFEDLTMGLSVRDAFANATTGKRGD